MSAETSIASARASVMIYDDTSKKWLPSGTSSGLSRVHIYQNTQNNTFRVVGRKIQDHEVVINSVILKNLKYNQATPIFHQWRENRQVYGLNFSAKEEADGFAHTMLKVIDLLNQATYGATKPMPPPTSQPVYSHIGPPEEYGDMRNQPPPQTNGWHQNGNGMPHGMDPAGMHHPAMGPPQQQPPMHQMMGDMHLNGSMIPQTQPTYMSTGHLMQQRPPNPPAAPVQAPMAPPMPPPGVPPAVAAPPPPPPPPGNLMLANNAMAGNTVATNGTPPAPPMNVSQNNSPPMPTGGAAPPPPPPPPPPGLLLGLGSTKPATNGQSPPSANSQPANNLAAAIANARLKRTTSIKEGESDGTPPKSAAPKGGNLMDEMAKTLARRRAQAERTDQNDSAETNGVTKFSSPASKAAETKVNGFSPSKEDNHAVKRNGVLDDSRLNGLSDSDLDRFKQEIMIDIKKELQKFKMDIIDALKTEMNRR